MVLKNIFVVLLIVSVILIFKVLPYYFIEIDKTIFLTYQFFIFAILIFYIFLDP
jgi:hypothetical protein